MILSLLEQIAAMDREWKVDAPEGIVGREALIMSLSKCCTSDPGAAELYLDELRAVYRKTGEMHQLLAADRQRLIVELGLAETQMRQLGSFKEPVAASAPLLNRVG